MNSGPPFDRTRLVAFYLPQFRPMEINDRNFGEGFTEWTHVRHARPLFRGHQQPVVPGELGYYDLRDTEVRSAQASLAREYGIDAFCYWHYWSVGERLMDELVSEIVAGEEPDHPFCLGWANHHWIDVRSQQNIRPQVYPGRADHIVHFRAIEPVLHDPRYLRVDGMPLIYLFRPLEIPNVGAFTDLWRSLAARSGLPGLHFVGQERSSCPADQNELSGALDAMVDVSLGSGRRPLHWRVLDRFRDGPVRLSHRRVAAKDPTSVAWAPLDYPCVTTNWDNTPRWERAGQVMVDFDPSQLATMVQRSVERVAERDPDHRLVFVKSWNEWGEGNYLEPDARWGRALLQAVREGRLAATPDPAVLPGRAR